MAQGTSMILRDVVRSMVESGEYIIAKNSWLTGKNKEFLAALNKTAKTDVVLKRVPPWAKARLGPAAAPESIQLQWYKMMKAHQEARARNLVGNARRNYIATRLAGKIPDSLKKARRRERVAEAIRELEQRLKAKNIDPEAILAAPAAAQTAVVQTVTQAAATQAAEIELRSPPPREGRKEVKR